MTNITLRDVPEELHELLRSRAAQNGQSLQAYIVGQLERVTAKPSNRELMEIVRERVEGSGVYLSAEEIVAAIHDGRR